MSSWTDFWNGPSTDSKLLKESALLPPLLASTWAALGPEVGTKRTPLQADDLWGDVVLDLPKQQLYGRRTPAALCRCAHHGCFCPVCEIGGAEHGSVAAYSRPGSRQTPRPGTRQTQTPRPASVAAEGDWRRSPTPSECLSAREPQPRKPPKSPYVPLRTPRRRVVPPDPEAERSDRRRREQSWNSGHDQKGLGRRFIETHMPAWVILREDEVRGFEAEHEAEARLRAEQHRRQVEKLLLRVKLERQNWQGTADEHMSKEEDTKSAEDSEANGQDLGGDSFNDLLKACDSTLGRASGMGDAIAVHNAKGDEPPSKNPSRTALTIPGAELKPTRSSTTSEEPKFRSSTLSVADTAPSSPLGSLRSSLRNSLTGDPREAPVITKTPSRSSLLPDRPGGIAEEEVDKSKNKEPTLPGGRLARLGQISRAAYRLEASKKKKKKEAPTCRELARQALLKEGLRIQEELNTKDAQNSLEAFSRYDEDESGTLELIEIRAVLEDLGLLPETAEEKSGVRQTLVNVTLGVPDGETDSEGESDNGSSSSSSQTGLRPCASVRPRASVSGSMAQDKDKKSSEELARSVTVTMDGVYELITRVRKRIKVPRQKKYFKHFDSYDIMDEGELDVPAILGILEDLKLLPQDPKEISDFCNWLLKTVEDIVDPEVFAEELPTPQRLTSKSLIKRSSSMRIPAYAGVGASKRVSVQFNLEDETFCIEDGNEVGSDSGSSLARSPSKEMKLAPKLMTLAVLKRALTGYKFAKNEFEVLIDYLQEVMSRRIAKEQLRVAHELGLENPRLFQEFRKELLQHRDLFRNLDDSNAGVLTKTEVWVALNTLGLLPAPSKDKILIMSVILQLCKKAASTSEVCQQYVDKEVERSTKNWEGLTVALKSLWDFSPPDGAVDDFCDPTSNCLHFEIFLDLISQVRAWHLQTMREELRPLYRRMLRKRRNQGVDNVIGVAEASEALELLDMAPQQHKHQTALSNFLSDVNEWGFQPLTIDFEAFVRFIRQVREWRAAQVRAEEREYAKMELCFSERLVSEYRVIFDIIDTDGDGELDISGVRRAVGMLRSQSLSSDQLRILFGVIDRDGNGSISFVEFLHLMRDLDPPKRGKLKSMTSSLFRRKASSGGLASELKRIIGQAQSQAAQEGKDAKDE